MDLIQKYGSVDTIYEKLPEIDAKPAAVKKLTAGGGGGPTLLLAGHHRHRCAAAL